MGVWLCVCRYTAARCVTPCWCCKSHGTQQQQKSVKRKEKKIFWTWNDFSPRILLYLVYPTEKTALFSTIFIQYIPLCNHKGHSGVFNNIVRKLCSRKSQYFYRLWILHWSIKTMKPLLALLHLWKCLPITMALHLAWKQWHLWEVW